MPLPDDDPTHKYEWLHHYIIDWAACGDEGILRFRVLTTIFRWTDGADDRARQYAWAEQLYGATWAAWTDEHRDNVLDLLHADVDLDPTYSPARFGRFLMTLRGGTLATGFLHGVPQHFEHYRTRPGYVFALAHWLAWFPDDPLPWPWYLFPLQAF